MLIKTIFRRIPLIDNNGITKRVQTMLSFDFMIVKNFSKVACLCTWQVQVYIYIVEQNSKSVVGHFTLIY